MPLRGKSLLKQPRGTGVLQTGYLSVEIMMIVRYNKGKSVRCFDE